MRIGRIIGGAVLAVYMIALVLAGTPPELRPSLFDRPHRIAVRWLGVAGIRAGQLVFHAESDSHWLNRAYCLHIRGTDASGEQHLLWPPGGKCFARGFRFKLPPVERTLYRIHRESSRLHYGYRKGKPTPVDLARSDFALRRVGDYMCRPLHVDVPELERIDVMWFSYRVHYETERLARLGMLQYRSHCGEGVLGDVTWKPSNDQMREFWGDPPPWL